MPFNFFRHDFCSFGSCFLLFSSFIHFFCKLFHLKKKPLCFGICLVQESSLVPVQRKFGSWERVVSWRWFAVSTGQSYVICKRTKFPCVNGWNSAGRTKVRGSLMAASGKSPWWFLQIFTLFVDFSWLIAQSTFPLHSLTKSLCWQLKKPVQVRQCWNAPWLQDDIVDCSLCDIGWMHSTSRNWGIRCHDRAAALKILFEAQDSTARSTFMSFPQRRAGPRWPSNSAIDFQFASYASILAQLLFQQETAQHISAGKSWMKRNKSMTQDMSVWTMYIYSTYVETVRGGFRYVDSTLSTVIIAAGSYYCTTRTRC